MGAGGVYDRIMIVCGDDPRIWSYRLLQLSDLCRLVSNLNAALANIRKALDGKGGPIATVIRSHGFPDRI